ncbi:MAG: hypothetical protein KDK89_20760, partial [Alphaproteobacteria bacterium]|nr:hypothetical protein [Alphaproteobacteria bacterium]
MNRQKAQKTIDTLRSASCETKEARLKKVMTAAGLKASGVCDHFDSSLNDFKGDQIRTKYLGSGLID